MVTVLPLNVQVVAAGRLKQAAVTVAPAVSPVKVTVSVVDCPCVTFSVLVLVEAVTAPGVPAGVSMANLKADEMPPPGVGLNTVMSAVPTAARSVLRMAALICVVLTKVVLRAEPFQFTTDPGTKLAPLMISVKAAEFCGVSTGERFATPGTSAVMVREPAPLALL